MTVLTLGVAALGVLAKFTDYASYQVQYLANGIAPYLALYWMTFWVFSRRGRGAALLGSYLLLVWFCLAYAVTSWTIEGNFRPGYTLVWIVAGGLGVGALALLHRWMGRSTSAVVGGLILAEAVLPIVERIGVDGGVSRFPWLAIIVYLLLGVSLMAAGWAGFLRTVLLVLGGVVGYIAGLVALRLAVELLVSGVSGL